jgi:hypothetical protein
MKPGLDRWEIAFVILVFTVGLILRLRPALTTYLNPDEALQALLAFGSWKDTLLGSLTVTHPPLLIVMIHAISLFSRTELALRLIPVLSGSLFPVFLFVWLRRLAGNTAAMAVLFLLTMAPHLITLSAQLRSYTPALLFLSASLVVLEQALESGRWRLMVGYSVLLWLCILSDYSMAWYVAGVGLYALLRLRGAPVRVRAAWAVGQAIALSLYVLLYLIQIRSFRGGSIEQDAVTDWLWYAFPTPGRMLAFPFVNTLKQLTYLMASTGLGLLAAVLFAAAIPLLWTGRTTVERNTARALAVLLVVPFAFAILGAYARQFPYGSTRHTVVLGTLASIGIAIALGALPRRVAIATLWGTLFLTPFWLRSANWDKLDIATDRNGKQLILQCVDYLRATIPPGALIFSERETLLVLSYYYGQTQALPLTIPGHFSETMLAGRWRVAVADERYPTAEAYRAGLAAFRQHYGLAENASVWVLDGGWVAPSAPPDEKRPFTNAVRVFQTAGN